MTPFWIALFLATQLAPTEPIRVYTGNALSTLGSQQTDSKVSKRSWDASASPALSSPSPPAQQPGLYKIKLTQNGYIQFVRYMADVPPLQQYTFCLWMKSRNYTHNHPLFSYSMQEKDSVVRVWLSPKESSLKIAIKNDVIARIPMAIREGRWYHVCQSWSGVTGEWVVHLDGKIKASDVVHRHRGTFLPGGGDVAVGQELTDFNKGLDDGVEGEIFGFNLVDEAVDLQDKSLEAPSHYRPDIDPSSFLPHFKKLPPIKKTFDEIQSYISKLPADAATDDSHIAQDTREGEVPAPPAKFAPIRTSKPRIRIKSGPLRKVVTYRESRTEEVKNKRVGQNEDSINFIPDPPKRKKINQEYDVNYNMHTYRGPKDRPKVLTYQIYEKPEDESAKQIKSSEKIGKDLNAIKRRARHNFDVYSLREANRLNPFYVKPFEAPRARFHFEKEEQKPVRRSFSLDDIDVQETRTISAITKTRSSLPEAIPVREVVDEGSRRRRRREADAKRDSRHIQSGIEANGFRPLPALPEGFLNLFSPASQKEDELYKLSLFLANKTSNPTAPPAIILSREGQHLQNRDPQKFPAEERLLLLQASNQVPVPSQTLHPALAEKMQEIKTQVPNMPGKSAGTELVRRSYGLCGVDRGSPVNDKRHLLVSWSDTPVRIYGGAMVIYAQNICGHF